MTPSILSNPCDLVQARALYGMTRDGADKLVALVRVSATAAKTLDGLLVDRYTLPRAFRLIEACTYGTFRGVLIPLSRLLHRVPELRNMAHRDALQDAKDRLRQEVDGLLRAVQVTKPHSFTPCVGY